MNKIVSSEEELKEFVVQFYRRGSDAKVITLVEAENVAEAREIIESEGCRVVSVKES